MAIVNSRSSDRRWRSISAIEEAAQEAGIHDLRYLADFISRLATPLLSRTARIAGAALLVFVVLAVQLFSYRSPTVDLLGSGEAERVAVEAQRELPKYNTLESNREPHNEVVREHLRCIVDLRS